MDVEREAAYVDMHHVHASGMHVLGILTYGSVCTMYVVSFALVDGLGDGMGDGVCNAP